MKRKKILKTILGIGTICSLFVATSCIAQSPGLSTDDTSNSISSNGLVSTSTSKNTTSSAASSTPVTSSSSAVSSTPVTSSSSAQSSQVKQLYNYDYATLTKCGYYAEYLGSYKRNIPAQCQDEGLSVYPKFGETLTGVTDSQKQAILDEAEYLISTEVTLTTANVDGSKDNGGYNRIDKDGYLYLDNDKVLDKNGNHRQLYKHTASEGMYLGDVKDSEPGIIKRITFAKRSYTRGYGITGLYAPAGEVIKVEISGNDMKKTDGITLHIGQALYNGTSNNIIMSRDFTRMPHILNTLSLNKDNTTYNSETDTYTGYIGSYLGGAIYVRNEEVDFTVTISGGVRYSHFILGYTTKAEFEQNAASSAPYFDLEVWDTGVLHSGPKTYASEFSYDDLYDVAVLWDKICQISTQVTTQGIVCFYEPHVTAGAACAFPGRGSVNCPTSWMVGSLDYELMVTSGSWGNLHEYNHNFQRLHSSPWGCGNENNDVVEVTNNLLNLIAYGLYTEVSASRQIGTVEEGLSNWNRYTSPSWSLRQITEERYENGKLGLALYSNLYHNFGEDLSIECINTSQSVSIDQWFNVTSNVTGYDMTYYMKDLIGLDVSESALTLVKGKNYPMFVPVSSIYQTGRSYTYNNKTCYTNTAQAYRIPYGEAYTLDLSKYITNGSEYVSGSIVIPDGFSYTIKGISSPKSGTLKKNSDYNYTYTPGSDELSGKIYVTLEITKDDKAFDVEDITLVFEFENSKELNKYTLERTVYTFDNKNKYSTAKAAYEAGYADYVTKETQDNINPTQKCSAEIWFNSTPNPCQTIELNGKYYIEEAGKYRIALRGRFSVALYVSFDGINYNYCASYENSKGTDAFPLTDGTYSDYILEENSYVYFKAVLKCWDSGGKNSFIGVGLGKFDSDNNVNISYVNAYRNDYEVTGAYESEYVYNRDHSYEYKEEVIEYTHQAVSQENYIPYNADKPIENLIDKKKGNIFHSPSSPLDETPLILTLDMGKTVEANRILLKGFHPYPVPNGLKLEVSSDGINYKEVSTSLSISNYTTTVDFNMEEFRYYRITFTSSTAEDNKRIVLQDIELYKVVEVLNGHQITLDSDNVSLYGDFTPSFDSLSTFGHSYNATKDDYILFEFEGTRFAIKSNDSNCDMTVIIDGKVYNSIDLECIDTINVIYMSEELSKGKHSVKIIFNGNSNIDSLIYFD